MTAGVRRAAVAGSWYPGTAAEIAHEVEGYLAAAAPAPAPAPAPGRLVGLISPHAGLRYSGPVAAHGYGLLRERAPRTVVLVGPSHRARFGGVALVAEGAFETPLGRAAIDEDLAAKLLQQDPAIVDLPAAHRDEHSLEMQLPFLQHLRPDAQILPVLMGRQGRAEVEVLARALGRVLAGRDALLVASSDLSHYESEAVAYELDAAVTAFVGQFDAEGLLGLLLTTSGHACGGGPMVAVMMAARILGADRASVLRYATSGDAGEHDRSRVVGYLSAALWASR